MSKDKEQDYDLFLEVCWWGLGVMVAILFMLMSVGIVMDIVATVYN